MPGTPMVLDQREQRERARNANDKDFDYPGRIKSFCTRDIGIFDPDERGQVVETKVTKEVF
jgi:hypothetical protein